MDTTVSATYRNLSQPIFLWEGSRGFFFVIKDVPGNATQQPIFFPFLNKKNKKER